jgi:hypothetical protein
VGFEVSAVDHQPLGLASLARETGEEAIEDAQAAPSDEAVVQGLVRTVGGWRVAPARPLRITKTMPLTTRRSSTRGMPWESGKKGAMRSIWAGESRTTSAMAVPPPRYESHVAALEQVVNGS